MDRSSENCKSDYIDQFIKNLVEFDAGFGELPFEVLVFFAKNVQKQLGKLPAPTEENWEEIVWLASTQLIDDPEDSL